MIKFIQSCIANAEKKSSKLTKEVLAIPGMTSEKAKHFFNNLGSMPDMRHLAVGLWKGASFVSTLYGNNTYCAVGIDNWSEFNPDKSVRETFFSNLKLVTSPTKIIEQDCWTVTSIPIINLYIYEGCHTEDCHHLALTHFYSQLTSKFIYVADDWSKESVQKGTYKAIKDLNLAITYKVILPSTKEQDWDNYWNGIGVFVLSKTADNSVVKHDGIPIC